ncbi:type II secretion system F family protein [Candidatus Woesearchaeota archaeon]|nr:type II secretion system F family protein [Candidatus Woesearchaeota archaeon]MBW3022087.1 type II secretion system F family protein [Candidatus Woesearchaeota archaeon]
MKRFLKRKIKRKKEPSLFLTEIVKRYFPNLKKKLLKSRSKYGPEEYFRRGIVFALEIALVLAFILGIIVVRGNHNTLIIPAAFAAIFIFFVWFYYRIPDITTLRIKREVDRQLLYLARHILIALDSGETLVNTMSKVATASYGQAGIMFEEIVDDIKVGTPLETSIQKAIDRSPSENLSKVLLEIQNALRIGTDISSAIERFIKELTEEGSINIKRYSKKMNSLTLFYLVVGVVMPSIGIAMATIMSSMINLQIGFRDLLIIIFFLTILQAMFLSIYKTLRRSVIV